MNFSTIAFSKNTFFIDSLSYKRLRIEIEQLSAADIKEAFDEMIAMYSESNIVRKAISLQVECMRNGFILDPAVMCVLINLPEAELDTYISDISGYLSLRFYNGSRYSTLFGDFPNTVMNISAVEYYLCQILHYMSCGEFVPNKDFPTNDADANILKNHMFVNKNSKHYRTVTLGSVTYVKDLFRRLASSESSLSEDDTEVLSYICDNVDEVLRVEYLHDLDIPFKETLCFLVDRWPEVKLNTMTDVLRYARYVTMDTVDLTVTKYSNYFGKKMSRPIRRRIMGMINEICKTKVNYTGEFKFRTLHTYNEIIDGLKDWVTDEEHAYHNMWVRLGELLHAGEYRKEFVFATAAFDIIRNDKYKSHTFNSRVEAMLNGSIQDLNNGINLLATRPGEFIRRFAAIVRRYVDANLLDELYSKVMSILSSTVLPGASIKVLYDFREYLCKNKIEDFTNNRIISYYAGASHPVLRKLCTCEPLPEKVINTTLELLDKELCNRYAKKTALESDSIFMIDRKLANIALPKDMKSMSSGMNQITRGSKIKLDNYDKVDTIRLYCRWYDKNGSLDFDLYSSLLNEDGRVLNTISWNRNHRGGKYAFFSGDVRCRPGYCAEYIDIDKSLALKDGVRYVLMSVFNFNASSTTFKDSDVYTGIVDASNAKVYKRENRSWYPTDIVHGARIITPASAVICSVFDLVTGEYLLIDIPTYGTMDIANGANMSLAFTKYAKYNVLPYMNILDVIVMNIESRGGTGMIFNTDEIDTLKTFKTKFFEMYGKASEDEMIEFVKESFGDRLTNLLGGIRPVDELALNLKKLHFIEYSDISSDYTKMFDWIY